MWFGYPVVNAAALFSPTFGLAIIGTTMAAGGLIYARRVAETMSKKITNLNAGQGLTANLTTAGLVLFASNLGVPVSTTHVSCGSIFGIGIANRSGQMKTITKILATWVTTLPVAALVSGVIYRLLA